MLYPVWITSESTSYDCLDSKNRLWMAFSTRESHWWPAAAHPRPDGYIVLLDEKGPRIVRDDIFFTNEIRLDLRKPLTKIDRKIKIGA
jgi:gluconolactonase